MSYVKVMSLVMLLSGCSVIGGRTYESGPRPADTSLGFPALLKPAELSGGVPALRALDSLRDQGLVLEYPPGLLLSETLVVRSGVRWLDVVSEVERVMGWVYDPQLKRFFNAMATHPVDAPDAFGRVQAGVAVDRGARPMFALGLRFVRVSGSLADRGAQLGAVLSEFHASVPDGVQASWQSVQERSYMEGIQQSTTQGPGGIVQTSRRTVNAGLSVQALASRLPGSKFRVQGTLEISSFTGETMDKASVSVPLELDGPRYQWIKVLSISGADLGVSALWRHFGLSGKTVLGASASGDYLQLWIRGE